MRLLEPQPFLTPHSKITEKLSVRGTLSVKIDATYAQRNWHQQDDFR